MRIAFVTGGAVLAAVLTGAALTPPLAAAAAHPDVAGVQVSADPYTNTTALHATEVEPDTVAVGHSVMSVFQVGRWMSGCSDDIGWALSNDDGHSWQHGYLPGLTKFSHPAGKFTRASDPTLAWDAKAGEWMALSLVCDGNSPKTGPSAPAVAVTISANGGHWFGTTIVARVKNGGELFDKPWITCDNTASSRYYGHCYAEWDADSATSGQLVEMSTSDNGGFRWSPAEATSTHLHGIAGEPVVQPNGDVVVPIEADGGLAAFRSTDGGRTWGPAVKVANIDETFPEPLFRGPFFPSVATDGAGRIYVTWPDCRFRPDCSSNDMVLTTSTDGVHWTPVTRIPIDPITSTVDHVGGGLGIDPTTAGGHARLGLFYNFFAKGVCNMSTCRLYEGYISSADGGAHWSAPQVVAGPMLLPELPFAGGYMVGDYEGAAVVPGGKAFSAFAVGGIPSAGQKLNEAMYEPSGGAPVTGGSRAASAAGAHAFTPIKLPTIAR